MLAGAGCLVAASAALAGGGTTILERDGFAVREAACPKCPMRFRIAADAKSATVNLSRLNGTNAAAERMSLAERAIRLMRVADDTRRYSPKRPLMGWASWNAFVLEVTEETMLSVARAMATNGLLAAGYRYVNLDDGFFGGRGPDGRLRFHPMRFPNGLKPMAEGIRRLGFRAGIYSDAGVNTCGSFNGDEAGKGSGLYGHEAADFVRFFDELGFDFIKIDYCGMGGVDEFKGMKEDARTEARYRQIVDRLAAAGHADVHVNVCRWCFPGTWVTDLVGSWRVANDIVHRWFSVNRLVTECLYLSAYAKPGHFNDMDMLVVGHRVGRIAPQILRSPSFAEWAEGLTTREEETHFGMWCMMSSPLLLGFDVRTAEPFTLSLVTNPFLLSMSQNDLGLQGYVVRRTGLQAFVLAKDADTRFGTARYVAFYNGGEDERTFDIPFAEVELDGAVDVFDLAERADLGVCRGGFSATVPPHGARFLRFDAERRLERTVYEAECAYLGAYTETDANGGDGWALSPFGPDCPHAHVDAYTNRLATAASGGAYVRRLGNARENDLVWREVRVAEAGVRRLVFSCHADRDRSLFVGIDGGEPVELKVPATQGRFADVELVRDLAAGTHEVRLSNAADWAPDVDRMRVLKDAAGSH